MFGITMLFLQETYQTESRIYHKIAININTISNINRSMRDWNKCLLTRNT